MNKLIKILNDIFRSIIPESRIYINVEKKKKIWEEFCHEKKGTINVKRTVDNSLSKIEMRIPYDKYEIIYKESDIHPLKIECEFNNNSDFSFQITVEDFIEKAIKLINNKEIEIGDEEFDNQYLIVTNDKERLIRILSNKELKDLLMRHGFTNLHIHKKDERSIMFLLGGRYINSKNELNDVFNIFKTVIESINTK